MDFIRGSSSFVRIKLHVSFKVKYSHPVFENAEFRDRCFAIFTRVAIEQQVYMESIGFDNNHVHMTWQINVTQSIANLTKIFKGTSGKLLLQEFPNVKKRFFWGSGLWGGQLYADSIGRDQEQLQTYVRSQRWTYDIAA